MTGGKSLAQLRASSGRFDWGKAHELDDISGQTAIVGIGETAFSGASGRNAKAICLEAIERAIEDAGLSPHQVDGLMVSFGVDGQPTPRDYHEHFGTSHDIWFSQLGGAMVWAGTSAHTASHALRKGEARYIVNVFGVDWATQRGAHSSYHATETMKAQFEAPFGWFPQPLYFATFARRHMHEYGTTEAQLGELALAFRRHANGHPDAVLRDKRLTLEDYLASPLLADPFRKEDCCLLSDGGAAFVMTSVERARDLPRRTAIVEGVGYGVIDNSPFISQQGDLTSTPQTFSAPWAYAMADISAADLDVIGVYDCFSSTALMQIEEMGFCDKGEGGAFVEGDRLHFDRPRQRGGIPCNTHGGSMSHAYILGMTHVVELVKQLRGTAPNQVAGAELAAYAGFTAEEASTLVLRRG